MFAAITPTCQPILRQAAISVLALVLGSGAFAKGNPNASMTIKSDPNPEIGQWATVSRGATSSTVGAANFYISYTVSITNPTNSSKNFRFVSFVTVAGPGATVPTELVSSRTDCKAEPNSNPVKITCPKLEVAKGATIKFNLTFRTPTAGTSMQMDGSLYFPVSSTTVAATASTSIALKEQIEQDYRLGFYTFVPTTGGTFCTGDNGNGGAANPGCVAKNIDPITTTIVIPSGSIKASTTARVLESEDGACQSIAFKACYNSSLTIPDTSFDPPLEIFLRIDKSKLPAPPNLNAANAFYEGNLVPSCASNPALPLPGQPCWIEKNIYPSDVVPEDFRSDFYIRILARDNGTYRLR